MSPSAFGIYALQKSCRFFPARQLHRARALLFAFTAVKDGGEARRLNLSTRRIASSGRLSRRRREIWKTVPGITKHKIDKTIANPDKAEGADPEKQP